MLEHTTHPIVYHHDVNNLEKTIDPLGDGISSLELVHVAGSDIDVANGARVSFGKKISTLSEKDSALINYLMEHNHTSPFEHNQLSFRIKAPIFVQRQWMRHRMASYNEISYRYTEAPLEYYVPQAWRGQHKINRQASAGTIENSELTAQYRATIEAAFKTYHTLMEAGVCRELARGTLPLATYTQFMYTVNLHSLMHFLKLRLGHGAQWEIQKFAQGLFELALPHFPVSLAAWKKFNEPEKI